MHGTLRVKKDLLKLTEKRKKPFIDINCPKKVDKLSSSTCSKPREFHYSDNTKIIKSNVLLTKEIEKDICTCNLANTNF